MFERLCYYRQHLDPSCASSTKREKKVVLIERHFHLTKYFLTSTVVRIGLLKDRDIDIEFPDSRMIQDGPKINLFYSFNHYMFLHLSL